MKVDHSEVEHVAMLARITLTENEKDLYAEQLSAILEYFETLRRVDTSGVPPTSHVVEITNVLRDDEVEQSLDIEDALKNAPSVSGRFFRVPKVLG